MVKTCQKCGDSFPFFTFVNGKRKNTSTRRYCLTCSPWGTKNRRRLNKYKLINGIEHKKCPACHEFKPCESGFYRHGDYTHTECKDCSSRISHEKTLANKIRAVDYKGGKCTDCHGVFPVCAYDFHHIDPSKKDFTIGNKKDKPWDQLKPELDKCILLCSNCHRIRHAMEKSTYNPGGKIPLDNS